MWKPEHRVAADRRCLRYPSDLIDAEWALVSPLIPPARRGGRKRSVDVREVLNAIFYVLATGCQWNALPKDLPPKSTAHFYLMLWDWDGTLETRAAPCRGFVIGTVQPISEKFSR
jgi:transposase